MKNLKLTAMIGKLLTLVLVGAMLGFMGCDSSDDPVFVPTLNLYETMLANPDLTVLKAYIEADPELKAILQGTSDYTIFAPTDDAFEKLKGTLGLDDLDQISAATIGAVLRFHFVPGKFTKAQLSGTAKPTEEGENVTTNSDGSVFDGGSDEEVLILSADNLATNGVIHTVETILIPPSLFAIVGATIGTLAQPILLGSDFTYLAYMLGVADSSVPSGEGSITSKLADNVSGNKTTFFATANAVIDGAIALNPAWDSVEDFYAQFAPNAAAARAYFLNHMIIEDASGTIYTEANLTSGAYLMESGLGVNITDTGTPSTSLPTGWVIVSANATQSPIYQFDVATNVGGVMHVSAPIY